MKLLFVFVLALATVCANELPKGELKSRNIVVTVGRPEGRIINGQNAQNGQFPYQVGLMLQSANGDLSWCGGSLLNNRKVLTAAHCTDGIQNAWVYLGGTTRESAEFVHKVDSSNFIIHPRWDSTNLLNDISIINIPYTKYTKNIQPVKLPSTIHQYSSYNGDEVIASGWGRVSDYSQNIATNLQYAHMNVMPNQNCRLYYGWVVTNSNICISTYGGSSTCQGDSGGPLVLASTKTQIGLTSFGSRDGCQKGIPAVFTRINSYLDWINNNAGVSY